MPNVVNEMIVRELSSEFEGLEGLLVFSMNGLTVKENEEFRGALAEGGVLAMLMRGSLARLALKSSGVELPGEVFRGSTAMVWGSPENTIHAAKVLTKSPLRKEGKLAIKAGVLEGKVLDMKDAAALADLPDRPTAQAQILGALSGSARGLATLIAAVPSGVARVLQAHCDAGAEGQTEDESDA